MSRQFNLYGFFRCPKPRNRPSFPQILSQLDLACSELLQWRDEDFSNLRGLWQEEIHLQLMVRIVSLEFIGFTSVGMSDSYSCYT